MQITATLKKIIKRFGSSVNDQEDGSININDHQFINSIISQPDFPWFISFPRTGSHWLRMVMELYFEKPSLVEVFYYKDAKKFTCYHRHDTKLTIGGCTNVLYLYRNPVDTIYSQLSYDKDDIESMEKIEYWANLYARHLSKWLLEETFTRKKTIITYDEFKGNMPETFKKVCGHFGAPFDEQKLDNVLLQVSKEKLKKKTSYNPQIVSLTPDYEEVRGVFQDKYSSHIYELIFSYNKELMHKFDYYEKA